MVPFVEEVPLKNLIKLRNREEDAFITYRLALNTAIETVLSSKDNFTGEDARSIYADIIDPNLAELEKKINMAKKGIVSKPLRSLVGVVGAVSFGILTGLIPQDVASIAKALGVVKFGSDIIQQTMALNDEEDQIKNEQYYFLWKVRKKLK